MPTWVLICLGLWLSKSPYWNGLYNHTKTPPPATKQKREYQYFLAKGGGCQSGWWIAFPAIRISRLNMVEGHKTRSWQPFVMLLWRQGRVRHHMLFAWLWGHDILPSGQENCRSTLAKSWRFRNQQGSEKTKTLGILDMPNNQTIAQPPQKPEFVCLVFGIWLHTTQREFSSAFPTWAPPQLRFL